MALRVYEDNAGGLHMTDLQTYVSGLESQPQDGGLIDDITTWVDWRDDATIRGPYADMQTCFDHPETRLIAEYDGDTITIHTEHIGRAAQRYIGLRRD